MSSYVGSNVFGNGETSSVLTGSNMTNLASVGALSIQKLEGKNYHLWVTRMSLILEAHDLFEVVNGEEERPVGVGEAKWIAKDKRARVSICLALSDTILSSVKHLTSSRSVWLKLESVYQPKSLMNKLVLRRKLMSLRMNEGDGVNGHINAMKQISDELCAIGAPVSDEDLVMTLLMSLPASFEHFITSLESVNESELDYDYVVSKIFNFDLRQKQKVEPSLGENAFMVNNVSKERGQKVCYYCKEVGHYKDKCEKLAKKNSVNAFYASSSSSSNVRVNSEVKEEEVEIAFMNSLIKNSKKVGNHWYLDSGATQHMCFDRNVFTSFRDIQPKKVVMGDNSCMEAVGEGEVRVQLSVGAKVLDVRLTKVLYVPKLKANLVSISRLDQVGFVVSFQHGCCKIYQGSNLIAEGMSENGLYRLVGKTIQVKNIKL